MSTKKHKDNSSKTRKKKNITIHLYDDQDASFMGYNRDKKLSMCSNNIICHPVRYADKYKKLTRNLINRLTYQYIKNIKSKQIKRFIIYENRKLMLWSI